MVNGIAAEGAQFALFGYHSFAECYEALQQYPLFKRMTDDWQTTLMVATTALSIISCAVAFFSSSMFLATTLFFVAGGSATGALCMHHFSALKSLRETAQEFGEQRQQLRTEVQELRGENEAYKNNNAVLEETTTQLRKENEKLEEANNGLKNTRLSLETETEKLKAQILVLKQSAETIHDQLEQTTATNTISKETADEMRAQLKTWKEVQDEICVQFKDQGTAMEEQLKQLGDTVQEVFKHNVWRERYDQLKELHKELAGTKDEINRINIQIAEKTAGLQQIHDMYVKMVDALDEQVKNIGKANIQHEGLNSNLGDQIGKLTDLIHLIRPFLPSQQ